MTALDRFKNRIKGDAVQPDDEAIEELLETAKEAIMLRRYPHGNWPDDLEPMYNGLQVEIALALYTKSGADYQTAHTENGISRSWDFEGIPQELLASIVPKVGVTA